ncbi:MAG: YifB family Mg chelatase-like AAA ATPase [Fidelibacterota bacterium]|nr:MAG: YifB family Mg chelatase-like AAA ATPase [Candidatus Neomarinimicrobiota bacterium]
MLSHTYSAAVLGVDAYIVKVECHLDHAVPPTFTTVGLPEGAVKESKERVMAALKNSGFKIPQKRTTVNLAPADIRKEGSAFDLPIALGMLCALGFIAQEAMEKTILVGELGLDGALRSVKGVLPITMAAREEGYRRILVPEVNGTEAALVEGIEVGGVRALQEVVAILNGEVDLKPVLVEGQSLLQYAQATHIDFSEVKGQEHAKRAVEVAAAGGHNAILIGPPGSGKTMVAQRIPTILPMLSLEEALETTKIHSVAGTLPTGAGIIGQRPFRAPHHTISDAGLVGGGTIPKPGEVSLAHHGVLFLDELPEFRKNVLEVLRQPIEAGYVTISRAKVSVTYPASIMLVAAMNPCPCGFATDPRHECSCTPPAIQRYMSRISGPLMDRIDIHVEVPAVKVEELARKQDGERSEAIRERVEAARERQRRRFEGNPEIFANAHMGSKALRHYCPLPAEGEDLLTTAINRLGLSARAYDRIIKVARTIADIAGSDGIQTPHLAEAIQYRSLDRQLWLG